MNNRSPKEIAMRWVAAYNSQDPDAAAALYAEDVMNVQLPWPKPVQGRDGMRTTYLKVLQAFPDIRVAVDNLLEDDSWLAVEWRFSGTMRGEFAGHSPNSQIVTMRAQPGTSDEAPDSASLRQGAPELRR